ncbi:vitelline membrane protein Vm32E-like [Musca domestica]|uniref:Vitelline membrane protein Vm32E-like n=1 Tax=Musca domestica TaxID=7370 RepID=A0A9J7CZF5_MUSDO|nr:vitelline membrane protein Vm32E-like [Musca domestica]
MKYSIAVFLLFVAYVTGDYGSAAGGGGGAARYGPVTIPAPPCPKNYLFSCQPSLSPAPCSPPVAAFAAAAGGSGGAAAGGAGGSAGAYSQQYPLYSVPQPFNGIQVNLDGYRY